MSWISDRPGLPCVWPSSPPERKESRQISCQHTEELTRRIEALLSNPATRVAGIELVAVELARDGRRTIIRVFIDRDGVASARPLIAREPMEAGEEMPAVVATGVSHEDCARVTRMLGDHLDSEPDIQPLLDSVGAYVLEVSSPGNRAPAQDAGRILTVSGVGGRGHHESEDPRAAEPRRHHCRTLCPRRLFWISRIGRTEIRFTEIKKAHLKCDPWQMVRAAAKKQS